nr:unnamed protein product [Callosobruchus analis]
MMCRLRSYCLNHTKNVVRDNKLDGFPAVRWIRYCCPLKGKNTIQNLLYEVQKPDEELDDKVTVVGIGAVGMACAFSILSQGVSNNVVLVGRVDGKLKGNPVRDPKIKASTDYAVSAGSRVCVVTAGVRQKQGETRTDLLQRNADLLKVIIPQLVKHTPDTVLIIVTNPCDVLSYVAWKVSGLPMSRIIGSGTNLDTSRFRFLIANRLNIAPASVNAWIIGEHGDTSVAVWSALNVAGVRLRDINPKLGTHEDPEKWGEIHKEVVNSAYKVIQNKGYTNWAIGLSATSLVFSILKNMNNVHAVSTLIQGLHGVEDEVYLSLPCTLGQKGVLAVVKQVLTPGEREALQTSALTMAELLDRLPSVRWMRYCCPLKGKNTIQNLLYEVQKPDEELDDKVTVVGIGAVGMACAFSILSQGVSNNVVLVGRVDDKLKGEMMDLQHGSLFLRDPKISASTDYAVSAGSRVCVVTAGDRRKKGETRIDPLQRNAAHLKAIIPQLVKHSPDTVLIIVTNPCDVLSYVAWKASGLPMSRIIGSGTNLDTSRFRFLIANRLNIAPASVNAWIIGEHGDNSVAVWSALNVAGVRLRDINPKLGTHEDPEKWEDIHKEVVNSAYKVVQNKGYTNWAIGLSVTSLVFSVLKNMNNVHAVSTLIQGLHGIEDEVYLSLPCTLGQKGVLAVLKQVLTPEEREALQRSAFSTAELIKSVKV